MKLELRSKGVRMTDGLRGFVEKKLATAFGRFGDRVQRVRVQLTDINGPKGGEDIACLIQTHMGRGGVVTIQETRSDPFAAVARASERASHRLSREVAKLRDRRKGK